MSRPSAQAASKRTSFNSCDLDELRFLQRVEEKRVDEIAMLRNRERSIVRTTGMMLDALQFFIAPIAGASFGAAASYTTSLFVSLSTTGFLLVGGGTALIVGGGIWYIASREANKLDELEKESKQEFQSLEATIATSVEFFRKELRRCEEALGMQGKPVRKEETTKPRK